MTSALTRARGQQGFALAETLVAAAIIAAALGATYEAIQTTARATTRLRDQRAATLIGTSVLARVGSDIALSPGAVDGGASGYGWRVDIEPYQGENVRGGPAVLFAVRVRVTDGDHGPALFDLSTVRMRS